MIRGWRDPVFRSTLSENLLEKFPKHPAGDVGEEIAWDGVMGAISEGAACMITFTGGCGTLGCTQIICTDACSNKCTQACPTCNQACTSNEVCTSNRKV